MPSRPAHRRASRSRSTSSRRPPSVAPTARSRARLPPTPIATDTMPENTGLAKLVFGRLTWDAIPLHEPILLFTFIGVVIGGVAVLAVITYFRWWGTLWRDWITSIDHKKIGVMYVVLGVVMLLRGFSDAVMMRAQQAMSFGHNMG